MSEINSSKNCLTEISEMLAEQNWRYLNFSQRLRVAEIRVKQIGLDADPIRTEIHSVRSRLEDLLHSINDGIDMRGELSEIDGKVERIETQLTT